MSLYLSVTEIPRAVLVLGTDTLIMRTLPVALTGGIWFLDLKGYNLSVATAVSFVALAGVAAEFGVVMLLYLEHAIAARLDRERSLNSSVLYPRGCCAACPAQSDYRSGDRSGPSADLLGKRRGI